jgi:tetratricopeptide (TPR) repeat protein
VLKDELMNGIWPESFVEESNLSQTIFMLRKTLGETAQDQRYIVTVRGTGYRFAESVREVRIEPEVPAGADLGPVSSPAGRWVWLQEPYFIAVALLIAVIWVGGFSFYRWLHRNNLTEQDTVVLAEFDNRTDDPIFDGTLRTALAIDLEQTPFLSLLSDPRVRATLKLMNHPEGEPVTREVALEVCQRTAGRAVIAGTIVSLADQYVVQLEALDCKEGGAIVATERRVRGKDAVLDALSQATLELRKRLGENLASVRKFDVPLREATTPSLEALKSFNKGAELVRHDASPSAAIPFYAHAIELDPNFALAYAYLGRSYTNIGEYQRAAAYIERAYAMRERVSEREKLLLTSFYLSDVKGDLDGEIETYKIWMQEHPRDWLPVDSLGTVLSAYFSEYEKAIGLYRRAIQLDPQQPFSSAGLARSYLALNRVQEARSILDGALTSGVENGAIRSPLYETAILQGDTATVMAQERWSEAQPVQDNIGPIVALAAAQQGRLEAARHQIESDVRALQSAGLQESAAQEYALLALIEASFGEVGNMRQHVALSLALGRKSNLLTLAIALALGGDFKQAESLEGEHAPFSSTYDRRFTIPCVHAAIAIGRGRFDKAISELESMRRYDLGFVVGFQSLYLRGLAFLGARNPSMAAAEFETIVDHRGVAACSPNWAMAHLGLARARALAGNAAGARSAYENLLVLWKDADRSLPLLRQAAAEQARQR